MLKPAGLWSHGDVLAHQDDPRSASLAGHALRRDLAAAAAVGIMNQGMEQRSAGHEYHPAVAGSHRSRSAGDEDACPWRPGTAPNWLLCARRDAETR